ncbi:MAG TPA: mandelate racemase/muconate lactonizing enzyme family protein [Solirubrobacterales bacterium]|nr:mandelate racemase/muconate lactonizing enzyme family protein [Solirubrobacterales bacterium]
MRLSSVEVIPYALPFKEPYVTARGVLRQREIVLLRVRDEDGVVGLGEAVPLSLRGGAGLAQVVRELEGWAERLEAGEGQKAEGLSAPARCAVAIAKADLLGRRAGSEAGAAEGEAVTCNATLVAGESSAVAADAERWAADGFTTFKLKLGAESAKTDDMGQVSRTRDVDVAQVRAVRGAVGDSARIRVDVNAAWDLETAKRTLVELEPFGIELAEQPVATLEEMAELAASTSIPLAADESVANTDEAEQAVALGACAYTGIKLSKVGGPEEALAVADVLPAYVSSALDGPVGIAAGAQVALSLGAHPERLELAHGLATQRLFAETIAAIECELRNGMLHLPPGPGLGVEIDEEALQAHRL